MNNTLLFTNPNPDDAGPIVCRPMGFPITAGCDTAWNRTRVSSDAASTDMQWLEHWTSNRKVARLNPRADKVKICRSVPEQGS
jgi:hypothetical protein